MSHPNETKTPRTDAEPRSMHPRMFYDMVAADFARQLEMELNDISTELRQAREQIESLKEHNLQLYDTMVERGEQVERYRWLLSRFYEEWNPDTEGYQKHARFDIPCLRGEDINDAIDTAMIDGGCI